MSRISLLRFCSASAVSWSFTLPILKKVIVKPSFLSNDICLVGQTPVSMRNHPRWLICLALLTFIFGGKLVQMDCRVQSHTFSFVGMGSLQDFLLDILSFWDDRPFQSRLGDEKSASSELQVQRWPRIQGAQKTTHQPLEQPMCCSVGSIWTDWYLPRPLQIGWESLCRPNALGLAPYWCFFDFPQKVPCRKTPNEFFLR